MTRLLVASRNAKKLAELRRVLDAAGLTGLTLVSLDDVPPFDEAPETGATFEENAIAKARDGYAATGLPTVADDSGIEVAALNGMPGVLSARWAGTAKDDGANNELLLQQLADVPDERRGAHFTCAVAFVYPVGAGGVAEHVVHGEMAGRVIRETRGSGGFGYDVLFVADERAGDRAGDDRTSAELSVAEKDAISHRGKAIREIAPLVGDVLGGL